MDKYRKFYININSECNNACRNCILDFDVRKVAAINIKIVEEKLNYIAELNDGVKTICEVSGGEPTISPQFFDILQLLKDYKELGKIFKIVILSNCMTSADENFAKKIACYTDEVVVSLYDCNAVSHDWFTTIEGSFERKITGISNLLNNGVKVHIKTLVMKPSYKNFAALAQYVVDRWGKDVHVTINGTHYTGDALTNKELLAVSYKEAIPYIEKALDIFEANKICTNIFLPLCMLDPKYWKYSTVSYIDVIRRSYSMAPNMEFGLARRLLDEFINLHPFCSSCIFRNRCKWPWKRYDELFGFKEIEDAYKGLQINFK